MTFCLYKGPGSPSSKKKEYDYNPNAQWTEIRARGKCYIDKDKREKTNAQWIEIRGRREPRL